MYVLSEDKPSVVESVTVQLGIQANHAIRGYMSNLKANFVWAIQERGHSNSTQRSKHKTHIMFIRDRTNDIATLMQANTGVFISSGTDVAISTVDVILLNPVNIHKSIKTTFKVSESSFRRIVWNFMWSFMYNLFVILLSVGAFMKFSIQLQHTGLGDGFNHSSDFGCLDHDFCLSSWHWRVIVNMTPNVGCQFSSLCRQK